MPLKPNQANQTPEAINLLSPTELAELQFQSILSNPEYWTLQIILTNLIPQIQKDITNYELILKSGSPIPAELKGQQPIKIHLDEPTYRAETQRILETKKILAEKLRQFIVEHLEAAQNNRVKNLSNQCHQTITKTIPLT